MVATEASAPVRVVPVATRQIPLQAGEQLAGLVAAGAAWAWLVRVAINDDAKRLTWAEADAWARQAGGELPTRAELGVLLAGDEAAAPGRWYWGQRHGGMPQAWLGYSGNGLISAFHLTFRAHAMAVRRIPV